MTGLPTVGGSFTGLILWMARRTARADFAERLAFGSCGRDGFGMGGRKARCCKGNVEPGAGFQRVQAVDATFGRGAAKPAVEHLPQEAASTA